MNKAPTQRGNMQVNRNKWGDIARLGLIVTVWSACFVVLSIFADFLMEEYFRGDVDALLIWLADFNHRLLAFAGICWLIVGVVVAVAKLQERSKVVDDKSPFSVKGWTAFQFLSGLKNLRVRGK